MMYRVIILKTSGGSLAGTNIKIGDTLMIAPIPTCEAVLAIGQGGITRMKEETKHGGSCDLYLNRSPLHVGGVEINAVRVTEAGIAR